MSETRDEICNNLATLTDADVPILRALNIAPLALRSRFGDRPRLFPFIDVTLIETADEAEFQIELAAKMYAKAFYFTIVAYTAMKILTLYDAI